MGDLNTHALTFKIYQFNLSKLLKGGIEFSISKVGLALTIDNFLKTTLIDISLVTLLGAPSLSLVVI